MKIKKFEGRAEKEVIEQVKQELGLDALILNIKTTKPRGMFSFMRHQSVEVTAAYDDRKLERKHDRKLERPSLSSENDHGKPRSELQDQLKDKAVHKRKSEGELAKEPEPFAEEVAEKISAVLAMAAGESITPRQSSTPLVPPPPKQASHSVTPQSNKAKPKDNKEEEKIKRLEAELRSTESLLEVTIKKLEVAQHSRDATTRRYDNNLLQVFYTTLTEQGVQADIAISILSDLENFEYNEELDIEAMVGVVYNKILGLLGSAARIDMGGARIGKPVVITFIGPTGVGKTTTIAKLSSLLILKQGKKVGLITADTYRIAAVEQLKTYSEILSVPIITAYNEVDLQEAVKKLSRDCEVIIIDTAGRSHKHKENIGELTNMLKSVEDSNKYLALSTTTKSEDIISIIELYSSITDFNLIFTKLDETTSLGSILNACFITGKKVAYTTNGQNVPDDIEVMQPEKITRALMGLGGF